MRPFTPSRPLLSLASAASSLLRLPSSRPPHRALGSLPYRIRAPLAKLQAKKALPAPSAAPGTLGDGEALEQPDAAPDYLRLALTSRVYDYVEATPLVHAGGLSDRLRAVVHLKREDLNPSYSFYIRGAYAKLADLKAKGCAGVIVVSIGSRGHAVGVAARRLGLAATVVMPVHTPHSRAAAVARSGATVVRHGGSMSEAQAHAEAMAAEGGLYLVRAHDDPLVIAGNATVGMEISRQHGAALKLLRPAASAHHLDAVFVPVGGGSLLAGVAAALKQISPSTKIIAVEPEAVDVMRRSLLSGHCVKIAEPGAEGIWVKQLGEEIFRICDELVDDVVTVSDSEIAQAIRDVFEDTRALLEPAGAISVAGLTKWKRCEGASLSGGNFVAIASDACNIEFDFLKEFASEATNGATFVRIGDRLGTRPSA